ncbi:MAG TPA: hypothetical protein VKB39_08670 [Candidatus Baltobacteraceae bacterium]|nr:hypothetical protein [Candidatus Baltobacteraceae bacterium]
MISFLASSVLTLAAVVTSPSLPPVSDVLSGMAKQTTGLQAYEVPVTIHASIRNGILAVPLSVTGERYFAAPDKEALKLNDVPALAKVFSNLYASLGTPLTWPQTYDLQVVSPDHASASPIYELRGTYKHTSSVDHILLDVDAETYEPVQVRWFYRNGSTIAMNVQEKAVGAFRLPSVEDVDVHFPGYSGHATIEYGAYAVNGTLPASAFGSQ